MSYFRCLPFFQCTVVDCGPVDFPRVLSLSRSRLITLDHARALSTLHPFLIHILLKFTLTIPASVDLTLLTLAD
jgi:hypothetical protein